MLVRVPFTYSARVTKKGKRTPSIEFFWEWLDLEVAEPDEYEAPVALRWRDSFPGDGFALRHKWGLFPADGVCESRWYEGNHWMPFLIEDQNTRSSAERVSLEALADKCSRGDDWCNPLMHAFHHPASKLAANPQGEPLVADDYRIVEDNMRQAEIEALRAMAANLISVGGLIWQRTGEPVCYIKEWVVQNHVAQGAIKIMPCNSPDLKDPRMAYRADRFDEAARAAILIDDYDFGANDGRQVEVLIPESLSYRDEELAFERSATQLLRSWEDKPIKWFTEEKALAWLALNQACAETGPERHDHIAEALERYATVADEDGTRMAEGTLARWRSRPIEMEEAGHAWTPR